MSATIGMTDSSLQTVPVATTPSTSSSRSDESAPKFAAALSAAHKSHTPTRDPKPTDDSDSAQAPTDTTSDDDTKAKPGTHKQSDSAVLDLPLQATLATVTGGVALHPVDATTTGASHRVRISPQDADTVPTTADMALPTSTMPLGLLPTAAATAAQPTGIAPAATTAASAAISGKAAVTATGATPATAPAAPADAATTTATALPVADTQPTASAPRTGAAANAHAGATTTPSTNATTQPVGAQAVTAVIAPRSGGNDTDRGDARDGAKDFATAATAAGHADGTAAAQSAQQPVQTQQVSTVAPTVAASAATATANPYAAAQPELAQSLAHLSTRANGEHEMTVALHPAELGAVHVRALMHDGVLTVTIACADESARHAVTAALPDLNNQLSDLKRLDVQLSGGQADGRSAGDAQTQSGDGSSDARDTGADQRPDVPTSRIDSTGRVTVTTSTSTNAARRSGGRNDAIDRWM